MTPTVADVLISASLWLVKWLPTERAPVFYTTTRLRSPSSTVPPSIDLLHESPSPDWRYSGDGWPDARLQHPRGQWTTCFKFSLCGAAPQTPVPGKEEGE